MIDFYLNGRRQHCSDVTADTSLLELLRTRLGQTGTKEGCASGDCGACTVAIGEPDADGELVYHNANACITPAHQVDGCHLVTVEGLARGERLHPAQAAMVDCHGSQCGFCTPGIVMSLFTLYENQRRRPAPLTQDRLEEALGGNLCRCTGYRPIRDAALKMVDYPQADPEWAEDTRLAGNVAWLRRPRNGEPAAEGHYVAPQDLAALRALKAKRPEARLVAGGTDLWLETTQQLKALDDIIDVRQVAELNAIEETAEGWWIGAAVTLARLTPLLAEPYPAFAHLMHRFASSQIRNRATLGGNIANASPIGDTPPVLLALDARLRLDGPRGTRELPLADFFLDYKRTALAGDEFIAAIFLPRPAEGTNLKVWKLSKRREDDISAVLGAFAWRLEDGVMRDVHLAFGGMAAIPRRAPAAEAALEGRTPDADAFAEARAALAGELTPMSDVRGSADYRRLAAGNLLERLRLMITAGHGRADDADNNNPATKVTLDAYAH
ncbi:xanthine dehydrogenase small subunit [Halomonas beimenensis]|uniref:Xanthine dehydrogenase iron-sulfur subunit / Xanthine dehydrogenase, FAD binding subunit n=1 Tax=Halomonas beimenensis TaxID=475662 RepID=A0A291P7X3_9GAMM|nr:xanthine dehydrogenase small subunit [Halomonas beimenensis]ATJ82951.1 xanthine dehydrogenase iron-sulfur subunit / Xanthine dehydrogenase, FAD binding subunit [Halomonas beimenensis]